MPGWARRASRTEAGSNRSAATWRTGPSGGPPRRDRPTTSQPGRPARCSASVPPMTPRAPTTSAVLVVDMKAPSHVHGGTTAVEDERDDGDDEAGRSHRRPHPVH